MKRPRFHEKGGIYIIICRANLKMYIGSSSALAGRFSSHLSGLKRNLHPNTHLQNAWTKYGEDQFIFGVLEYIREEDQLFPREQYYLDTYRPFERHIGFNNSPTAETARGHKMTEEVKEAIRQRQLGHIKSSKTIQKFKDAWVENYDEWQQASIDQRGVTFEIVSPDGVLHNITGLKRFCREQDLDPAQLARVLKRKGQNRSVGGWHLPDTQLPPPRYLRDPTGVIHTICHLELKAFGAQREINSCLLGQVLNGKRSQYKGWTRADSPTPQ